MVAQLGVVEDQFSWVSSREIAAGCSRGLAQLDVAVGSAQLGVVEGSSAGCSRG
jgi:hypothetical protein